MQSGSTQIKKLCFSPLFPRQILPFSRLHPLSLFAFPQEAAPRPACRKHSWAASVRSFLCMGVGLLSLTCAANRVAAQQESAGKLMREVVYNELHDHDQHGYWRYWVDKHSDQDARVEEQVETSDGPLARLVMKNGRRLDAKSEQTEQARLDLLMRSANEQANQRAAYAADEKRITTVVSLMPDAYLYQYVGDEKGCHHLRFQPNPAFKPHTIEARVVHAMTGDLWVDARMKRLARLEARLDDNLQFGFGLLGRLNKGGWFRIERTQVSRDEWKTARLEVHMTGRAILFKTISRECTEVRTGFTAVPARMTLAQGMKVLDQTVALVPAEAQPDLAAIRFAPSR